MLPYNFPQGVNFNSNDHLKTCQFYEFILVDTNSIKITHNINRNNPRRITFSKCQILRVMTIADWNKKPFTYEVFRQPFHPMSFNYIDYMDVRYNMIYLHSYQHSWFMQFSRGRNAKFLAWFKK